MKSENNFLKTSTWDYLSELVKFTETFTNFSNNFLKIEY